MLIFRLRLYWYELLAGLTFVLVLAVALAFDQPTMFRRVSNEWMTAVACGFALVGGLTLVLALAKTIFKSSFRTPWRVWASALLVAMAIAIAVDAARTRIPTAPNLFSPLMKTIGQIDEKLTDVAAANQPPLKERLQSLRRRMESLSEEERESDPELAQMTAALWSDTDQSMRGR